MATRYLKPTVRVCTTPTARSLRNRIEVEEGEWKKFEDWQKGKIAAAKDKENKEAMSKVKSFFMWLAIAHLVIPLEMYVLWINIIKPIWQ